MNICNWKLNFRNNDLIVSISVIFYFKHQYIQYNLVNLVLYNNLWLYFTDSTPSKIQVTVVSLESQNPGAITIQSKSPVPSCKPSVIVHSTSPTSSLKTLEEHTATETPSSSALVYSSPKSSRSDSHSRCSKRKPLVKQNRVESSPDSQINKSVPSLIQEEDLCSAKPHSHMISKSNPLLPHDDMVWHVEEASGYESPKKGLHRRFLLRSKSSGAAKYSRFRDRYLARTKSPLAQEACSDVKATKSEEEVPLTKLTPKISKDNKENSSQQQQQQHPQQQQQQHSSGETGSDLDDSLISDWAELEAACDAEVKNITGDTEEEDDVKPTLNSFASESHDDSFLESSNSDSNLVSDSPNCSMTTDSDLVYSHSKYPGQITHSLGAPEAASVNVLVPEVKICHPGVDNSSFELGEVSTNPDKPPCGDSSLLSVGDNNSDVTSDFDGAAVSSDGHPDSDSSWFLGAIGYTEQLTDLEHHEYVWQKIKINFVNMCTFLYYLCMNVRVCVCVWKKKITNCNIYTIEWGNRYD